MASEFLQCGSRSFASSTGSRSPLKDGLYDPHACHPGNIADHMGELEVHLLQSLLHVLDVMGGIGDQHRALSQIAAQDADLIGGAKRSA